VSLGRGFRFTPRVGFVWRWPHATAWFSIRRSRSSVRLAPPGAVRLYSSNQRVTLARVIRSSGCDSKAGSRRALRARVMVFRVDGLHRSKHTCPGPATKSPKVNTASGSGPSDRAPVSMARHLVRASSTLVSAAGPSAILRAPSSSFLQYTKLRCPDGRTRTPRPAWRVSHTVYSWAAGANLATLASVRRRLFAAMLQPSRAAPTASAAPRTMASDKWMYLSVVSGLRCPSRRPMVSTVSPCARATLAYVCRRS